MALNNVLAQEYIIAFLTVKISRAYLYSFFQFMIAINYLCHSMVVIMYFIDEFEYKITLCDIYAT